MSHLGSRPEIPSPPRPTFRPVSQVDDDIWLTTLPEQTMVSVRAWFPVGYLDHPELPPGVGGITNRLLSCGAGLLDDVAFSRARTRAMALLSAGSWSRCSRISLTVPEAFLDRGLELLAMMRTSPRFDVSSIQEVVSDEIVNLRDNEGNSGHIAWQAMLPRYWGVDSEMARYQRRSADVLEGLLRSEIQSSWQRRFRDAEPLFLVAGPVREAKLREAIRKHFPPSAGASSSPSVVLPQVSPGREVLPNPMANQAFLRVDLPCAASLHPDRPGQSAGSMALGYGLSSRLPSILRARLGWTYGVDVETPPARDASSFHVSCFVQEDVTFEARDIIERELRKLTDGIHPDELKCFLAQATLGFINSFESSWNTTDLYCDYLRMGLLPDGVEQRARDFLELTLDEACDALSRLPVDLMVSTTVLSEGSEQRMEESRD